MSNRLLVTSEYNFKSGYNTLLSTILEESVKKNVVVIPKYYNKPDSKFSSFFESYPARNGTEKELLLFPPFVWWPILFLLFVAHLSSLAMAEARALGTGMAGPSAQR